MSEMALSVLNAARAKGLKIATAESCTGGLVAAALTEIAGSSDVFERGFVTYSNEAKSDLLGVPSVMIVAHGAVSVEVAISMAERCLINSRAGISVSVTGIAGPGGGSALKPVGLVHFAVAQHGHKTIHHCENFGNLTRANIRRKSATTALQLLLNQLE